MSVNDHSRDRRWLLRALGATFGAGVAVVTGISGATRARASSCLNQAVFDACKSGGNAALEACAFDDWTCKCAKYTTLQTCYLQCQDDPELQQEAQAVSAAREQACSLAA